MNINDNNFLDDMIEEIEKQELEQWTNITVDCVKASLDDLKDLFAKNMKDENDVYDLKQITEIITTFQNYLSAILRNFIIPILLKRIGGDDEGSSN